MRKTKIFAGSLLLVSLLVFSCTSGVKDIDGNSYKIIKIGNQSWMTENLNVSRFRNGDSIPEVKSNEEWVKKGKEGKPAWCYFDNNPENGKKYGKLYNWYAASDPRGLAPKGWHASTDAEWTKLINFYGGGIQAALKMRTTGLGENDNGGQKGFSGLPGGCRNSYGLFYGADSFGYWWSTTESNAETSWIYILNYMQCNINSRNYEKIYGVSVRCVKE
jgi:uncharacterized protein (TIGR02145 family)